jgi:dsRNA-specific ribonuclease
MKVLHDIRANGVPEELLADLGRYMMSGYRVRLEHGQMQYQRSGGNPTWAQIPTRAWTYPTSITVWTDHARRHIDQIEVIT